MEPTSHRAADDEGAEVVPLHAPGTRRTPPAPLAPGEFDPAAREDALTGLHGHPWFEEDLRGAAQRRRGGENPWVAVAEVEGLDGLGPRAADEALRALAIRVYDVLRAGDKMARIGGLRLGLIVDAPSGEEAITALERIEREVRELAVSARRWPDARLRFGVAPLWHQDPVEALAEASRALARALAPGGHAIQMSTGLRPASS
jgi:GGDEF domain-containing protein